jgi:hypothetical protein
MMNVVEISHFTMILRYNFVHVIKDPPLHALTETTSINSNTIMPSSGELPHVAWFSVWLVVHFVLVCLLTAVERTEIAIASASLPLAGSATFAALHL